VLPVEGRLALEPADTGAVLRGIIISEKENWIINRVRVHVWISETRHCGEKLQDPFSDIEWDKHCAENPNHSVADVVEGKRHECFVASTANSNMPTPKPLSDLGGTLAERITHLFRALASEGVAGKLSSTTVCGCSSVVEQ
jgi:hypothetical protein